MVLIGEPPRSQYDVHFQVLGFPVRVHPMFWFVALILGIQGRDTEVAFILIWGFVVFLSILIHELGHALTIRHYGWASRIILYGMGGLATIENANPYASSYNENDTPKAKIAIALAGPAAGFAFAGIIIAILYAAPIDFRFVQDSVLGVVPDLKGIANPNLRHLLWSLLFVNVFWGVMNLLPVYPLDGGQVARELFSLSGGYGAARSGIEKSLMLSAGTGAIVACLGILHFGKNDWRNGFFIALLFGYLAFMSYRTLQNLRASGYGGGAGGHAGYGEDDDDWWRR